MINDLQIYQNGSNMSVGIKSLHLSVVLFIAWRID